MNPRPASTLETTHAYRSGALPAYYLGRSAAIWLASSIAVSGASHRDVKSSDEES